MLHESSKSTGYPAALPLLDDRPEEQLELLWPGLRKLAERLAALLPSLPPTSPVLLSGEWGSGKTTLLLALQRHLVDQEGDDAPIVWFDAWRYEQEAGLLPALMRAVWEATPEQFRTKSDIKKKFFDPLWRSATMLGLKAAPWVATLMGMGFLEPLLKTLSPADLDKNLSAIPDLKSLEPQEDETTRLWKSFRELLREAWGDRAVVILIDDLDRCSPEGTVALLEGIRLLLFPAQETNCHFVLALDKKIQAQAIGKKFEGISNFDGNRYLEKLFPISFEVPVPGDRDVGSLVRGFLVNESDEAEGHFRDQQDALSEALADPIFANPRLMKRSINRFRLVLTLENRDTVDEEDRSPRGDRALAKWIAACERWPDLRPLLRRRDEPYWREVYQALTEEARPFPDPEAERLLAQEGIRSWMLREVLGRNLRLGAFRQADMRLRRWGL